MKRIAALTMAVAVSVTIGMSSLVVSPASAEVQQPEDTTWPTQIFEQPDPAPIAPSVSVERIGFSYVLLPQVYVAPHFGRTFVWQVNNNGTWEDFMPTTSHGTGVLDPVLPETGFQAPEEEGIHEFRLYSPPTKYDKEFISSTVRMAYQDPEKWYGLRSRVKEIIKSYCPEPMVEVNAPKQEGLMDVAGLYISDSAGGTLYIMEGVDESTPDQLLNTSLHECAHSLQDAVAQSSDMNLTTLDSYLQPIYGPFSDETLAENPDFVDLQSAIEQNAQCMTYLMGTTYTSHSYIDKNQCTGAKESAARDILEGKLPSV